MKYEVIQSGSTGNCIILDECIALDMGVPFSKVRNVAHKLKLVFIGHRHSDHFCKPTIHRLAIDRPTLRFCGGEWMVPLFLDAGVRPQNIDVIDDQHIFDYGEFQIRPVPLVHDVPNFGLRVFSHGEKVIYAVDTRTLDGVEAENYDLMLIESNYKEAELKARLEAKKAAGEYAYESRVTKTHMSEEQTIDWLTENMGPNSQYVFLHQHEEKEKK